MKIMIQLKIKARYKNHRITIRVGSWVDTEYYKEEDDRTPNACTHLFSMRILFYLVLIQRFMIIFACILHSNSYKSIMVFYDLFSSELHVSTLKCLL